MLRASSALERCSCDHLEGAGCGGGDLLVGGTGADGGPLGGVVGHGPAAAMHEVMMEGAHGHAAVEVGFAALAPGIAVVNLGDALAAGGKGAAAAEATTNGPPLRGGPLPGL